MRGQALAEFAIGTFAFLLVLFATMDMSRALYAYNFVSEAARDATRYAAVHGKSSKQPASTSTIQTLVSNEALSLDPTALTVTTIWTPDNSPGNTVKVQVSYTFKPIFPLLPSNIAVSSTSQMVISN